MPFSMRERTSAWVSLWGMVREIVLAMQVLRKSVFAVPQWIILVLTQYHRFGGVMGVKNGQTGIYYRCGSERRSARRPSGGASARARSASGHRGARRAGDGRGGGAGSFRDNQAGGGGGSRSPAGAGEVGTVQRGQEIICRAQDGV